MASSAVQLTALSDAQLLQLCKSENPELCPSSFAIKYSGSKFLCLCASWFSLRCLCIQLFAYWLSQKPIYHRSIGPCSNSTFIFSLFPSQLWIRMQFAPELEAIQAFNWFAVLVLVLVLVVVNEKNWKPFEVKSYLAFGKPEAGPAGRSLARS